MFVFPLTVNRDSLKLSTRKLQFAVNKFVIDSASSVVNFVRKTPFKGGAAERKFQIFSFWCRE
jgi:hypothetical protein